MTIALLFVISVNCEISFFNSIDDDQNKNRMVNALEKTDTMLTIKATCVSFVANKAKKAPIIWYNGAPGGCPTSSLAAVAMYSPQSQKLMVGSTVRLYVIRAIVKANQPVIVFHLLKLNVIIIYLMVF